MKTIKLLPCAIIISIFTSSCAPFRDSVYSDRVLHSERNLNNVSTENIGNVEADGTIRIAVFADSHQNYKDLDLVIQHINRTANIDFAVSLGDVTNSSYNLEYDQYLSSYLLIKPPSFNILGNHDAIGAGPEIFKKLFGNLNFYFESTSHRYVFFNSANLEQPALFDPLWLKQTVEASTKPVIIFTHIPLRDQERFTDQTAIYFNDVIQNPKTQLILNGHNHVYNFTSDSSTAILQSGRTEGGQWLLLEITGTQLGITRMETGSTEWFTLKN